MSPELYSQMYSQISDNSSLYAHTFGKVEGAYCFGLVRPSARSYVRSKIKIEFEISLIYEGCPSKSWTFVITRDCVPQSL